jgi:hypothetical protein
MALLVLLLHQTQRLLVVLAVLILGVAVAVGRTQAEPVGLVVQAL